MYMFLMRDEKEERKKQARLHMYVYVLTFLDCRFRGQLESVIDRALAAGVHKVNYMQFGNETSCDRT